MKAIESIKAINWKDVAMRSFWTFAQVFIATVIIAAEPMIDSLFKGDLYGLWALAITTTLAATAAGLSAVKTVVVEVVRKLKTDSQE